MNISNEIWSLDPILEFGSNSSVHNNTKVDTNFEMTFFVAIITIFLSVPTNSYVIWLIVTGTGNGLVAEFFILNLAVCDILICVECVVFLLIYKFEILWIADELLDSFAVTGRTLFQCLICVEHYLAVVHPVSFLKYKLLRYRVMCSVFIWVAAFISSGVHIIALFFSLIVLYWVLVFAHFFLFFSIQLFCCVSVLRALKQSGPGEGKREKVENHVKRRAFFLILITNVILTILYIPYVIFMYPFPPLSDDTCNTVSYGFYSLACLVQPLAFFYRVGKLPFMKRP